MAGPWLRRPLGMLVRLHYYVAWPATAERLPLADSRPRYHGVPIAFIGHWRITTSPPCFGLSIVGPGTAAFHACVFLSQPSCHASHGRAQACTYRGHVRPMMIITKQSLGWFRTVLHSTMQVRPSRI